MKRVFESIRSFFRRIFGSSLAWLQRNSEVAVRVTENLKKVVESPVADLATALIPGELDNAVLIKLRKTVPEVAVKMAIAHNIIQNSTVPSEAIAKTVEYLKTLSPTGRAAFWVQFAGELNLALADGKITFPEAVALSQLAYVELYKKEQQP